MAIDSAQREPHPGLQAFLQSLMGTSEARTALRTLISTAVFGWAGRNPLKKKVAGLIADSVDKGLTPTDANRLPNESALEEVVADAVKRLSASLLATLQNQQHLPPEEKEKQFRKICACLGSVRNGHVLNWVMAYLHDLHSHNPTAVADALVPVLAKWVAQTDFGLLREAADTLAPEAQALAEGINDILWQYPAKLVLLLSLTPDVLNLMITFAKEGLCRFNQAAPDLVADIALSLVRSMDGEALGAMMSELTELMRKIHTGSALIGEPGTPRLHRDLQQMAMALCAKMEARAYWQTRIALAENKAAWRHALAEALSEKPDFLASGIQTYAARKNPALNTRRHTLETIDTVSDEALSDAAAKGLSHLDLQELGEVVNLSCLLGNRLMALNPDQIRHLCQQLAASLDLSEIETFVQGILAESEASFRPVARAVLPDLVSALSRAMTPVDDANEPKMARARQELRALLLNETGIS
jgi:hypothetical protein